jgi:serine/threonine protein kinase
MRAPERFENYELLRREDGSVFELGRGGMGVTYKAWDTDLHCEVALKVISPGMLDDTEAHERFLREARAAARLRHPNIATVYRLGRTSDETYFYAMEFCEGPTLHQALGERGPLPAQEAVRIVWQVSKALTLAESHQLLHRDLKPSNLILTASSDDGTVVKVIDFGLAKSFAGGKEALATLGTVGFIGTASFASPEQLEDQDLDIRSDLYSLGVCLWFMLTGQPPFAGSLARLMSQTLFTEPPWEKLAGQPAPVLALLRRMLAKDRDQRPVSAAALRTETEHCLRALDAPVPKSEPRTVPAAPPNPLVTRFRLSEKSEADAFGRVFRATDLQQGGTVAYHWIDSTLTAVPMTRRDFEAQFAAAMAHPHESFVNVLASGAVGPRMAFVTEWIEGFSLFELLKQRGSLSPQELLLLLAPLAEAADHARMHGLSGVCLEKDHVWLHFPEGLSAERREEALRARLSEWPACLFKVNPVSPGDTGCAEGSGMNSMMTMGPAAGRSGATVRSNVVALAGLACEILGSHAVGGAAFTPIPRLSESANVVLRRACAEEGAFSSAAAFVAALSGAIGKSSPANPRAAAPAKPAESREPSRIRPLAIAAGVALLLSSLGFGYYHGIHLPRDRERERRAKAAEQAATELAAQERLALAAAERQKEEQAARESAAAEKANAAAAAQSASAPASKPELASGRILVNTIPSGATVHLDGRENGTSPLVLDAVAAGLRRLRVNLPGYEPVELMVEVTGDQTSHPGTVHLVAQKNAMIFSPAPKAEPLQFASSPQDPGGFGDELVLDLVRRELLAIETGDLVGLVGCYSSPVDYYDEGRLSSAQLLRSLESFRRQWPLMDIADLSVIRVSGTSDPNTKTAAYHYNFVARNPQKGKRSSGIAHESITVRSIDGRLFIVRCRQEVTGRKKNF